MCVIKGSNLDTVCTDWFSLWIGMSDATRHDLNQASKRNGEETDTYTYVVERTN